jgi:catechol 2,3-dioxygenase-like lactoylglutathione lyase family enzyme
MKTLVKGIHHITLCPGSAQEDIDFFTEALGFTKVGVDGPFHRFQGGRRGRQRHRSAS